MARSTDGGGSFGKPSVVATVVDVGQFDPVSGDFIFIFGHSNTGSTTDNAELWKLNPDGGGTWTLLDGLGMVLENPKA